MVEPPTSAYHLHPDSLGMANTTEDRKIIAALAQARHPATGEPLTEQTALSVLHHPRVRRALARLGHKTSDKVITHTPTDAQPIEKPPQNIHERMLGYLRAVGYTCLFIWPAFLVAAPMIFDAPGAERQIWTWTVLAIVLLMPVLIFVMPKLAGRALARGHTKFAYALALLPIIPFALPFVMNAFFWLWFAIIR